MEEAANAVRHPVTKPRTMNTLGQCPPQPTAPLSVGHQPQRSQQGPLADASLTSYTPSPQLHTTARGRAGVTTTKPGDRAPRAPGQRRCPVDQMQGPGPPGESEDP
jgi:hypothetical protein